MVLSVIVIVSIETVSEGPQSAMENITQTLKYRESLVKYAKSKGLIWADQKQLL